MIFSDSSFFMRRTAKGILLLTQHAEITFNTSLLSANICINFFQRDKLIAGNTKKIL